jgi:hypothetical protein
MFPALIDWMNQIRDEAGPDLSEVRITEDNRVTIICSIASTRVFSLARELSDAGHKVTVLHVNTPVDFNLAHYGLEARRISE